MNTDIADRATKLAIKWLEKSSSANDVTPDNFARQYVDAYHSILHVLADNEMPEAIDASAYFEGQRQ